MNLCVLVMTCDKNLDICNFVIESINKFQKCSVNGYISTETDSSPYNDCFCFMSNGSFSRRMVESINKIKEDYVLVLLDDYYIYDNKLHEKIETWMSEIKANNLSALKLCHDGKIYKKVKKSKTGTKIYKKINVYDIDFHPTIWKKEVLIDILQGKELSPWQIEPLFSKCLSIGNNICGISRQKISYDELIIGGKFFKSAFKKHCKGKYNGDRQTITQFQELNFRLNRFFRHITPRVIINIMKKIIRKKGYSDQ